MDAWLDDPAEIRGLVDEVEGKMQWERKPAPPTSAAEIVLGFGLLALGAADLGSACGIDPACPERPSVGHTDYLSERLGGSVT